MKRHFRFYQTLRFFKLGVPLEPIMTGLGTNKAEGLKRLHSTVEGRILLDLAIVFDRSYFQIQICLE